MSAVSKSALTIEGELLPLLRAVEATEFYGSISLVFEHGVVKDVDVRERMKFRDQVREFIRRMIRA